MVTDKPLTREGSPIQDVYYLETIEQLQAISDPIRYRMVIMMTKPMTGAQLARALDMSRPRARYHLKLLEEVGVVKFVGEGMSHGITEKYYQVVGRMLNFSKLMPNYQEGIVADDMNVEVFSAISQFLAAMLDVSRESILKSEAKESMSQGIWFDFASILKPEEIEYVKGKLSDLREEIIEMTRQNRMTMEPISVMEFRTTLFLTLLSDVFEKSGDYEDES
jgi:DNA-binding transcriptional ArsR family regulator